MIQRKWLAGHYICLKTRNSWRRGHVLLYISWKLVYLKECEVCLMENPNMQYAACIAGCEISILYHETQTVSHVKKITKMAREYDVFAA